MSDSNADNQPDDQPKPEQPAGPGEPQPQGNHGTHSQQFSHNPVAARVPERVARGSHATGVLVLDSPTEFVIDFLQAVTRPFQIVSRIVVHPAIMGQIATALQDNLNKYSSAFGAPPAAPPPPPNQKRPTIQEIYENVKLPEEQLSGNYANSVMIGHTQAEFYIDFITGFYPTAAVSSRIFLSAAQAPRVLDTINVSLQQHQKRYPGGPQPHHRQQPPPSSENP
jgi:hypothetical protein